MSGVFIGAVLFKNGETARFKREIAISIFNRGAIDSDVFSDIIYWSDGEAEIRIGDEDEIEGVWCVRFTSLTFVERLYELAQKVKLAIAWPGSGRCWYVTDETVIPHLPPDFTEDCYDVAGSLTEFIAMLEIIFVNPRPWDRIA